MKCPKCHYLSFEPEPRCRNCGYDLDLQPDDLVLKSSALHEGPLADLTLRPPEALGDDGKRTSVTTPGPIDLDRVVGGRADAAGLPGEPPHGSARGDRVGDPGGQRAAGDARSLRVLPAPARPARSPAGRHAPARGKRAPSTTAELPLFVKNRPAADPDAPLVKVPAEPTPPLAVRRPAPAATRPPTPLAAADASLGPFERDLLQDLKRLEQRVATRAREDTQTVRAAPPGVSGRRLGAAAIDATLLGTISASVLWATLRVCDLGLGEAATLPAVPLAAFLLLVAAGYLLMFTVAGGQTVGMMLMRIRVVAEPDWTDDACRLTPRQAAVRALLTVPSVLLFGLGFLPAILGHGGALHDRLSHTRIVEA